MAANTSPIYSLAGDIQSAGALIRVAATVPNDGSGTIGTDVYKIWTADATNGGLISSVIFKYVTETGTTTSNACVMRVYVSSTSSGAVTDANCWLIREINIPATGAISTTAGLNDYEVPIGRALNPGYTILAKVSVTQPTSCGFIGTGFGGKY